MENDLADKLSKEIDSCDWSLLEPHYKRDALLVVKSGLKLAEVGVALAQDDVEKVKKWQSEESIRRPLKTEVELWEASPHTKMAQFLIIQPFVLIQILDGKH